MVKVGETKRGSEDGGGREGGRVGGRVDRVHRQKRREGRGKYISTPPSLPPSLPTCKSNAARRLVVLLLIRSRPSCSWVTLWRTEATCCHWREGREGGREGGRMGSQCRCIPIGPLSPSSPSLPPSLPHPAPPPGHIAKGTTATIVEREGLSGDTPPSLPSSFSSLPPSPPSLPTSSVSAEGSY